MKKIRLLLIVFLAVCSGQTKAQEILDTLKTTVADPDVTFDVPNSESDYLDISKAWIPSDSDASKPRCTADGDGFYEFNNMRNENFAVFHLKVTKEAKMQAKMQVASKQDGSSLLFQLYNADTKELELEKTVKVPNTTSWTKFMDTYFITDKKVSTGNKTLIITFLGSKYTANMRQLQLVEFADQATYSLYTYVNPSDDAGTIAVSPEANTYIDGTSITVKATPAVGYKFVNWTDADDRILSTDASYTFLISQTTDLNANFEAVNMVNDIPGTLDPESGIYTNGAYKMNPGGKMVIGTDTTAVPEDEISFDNFRTGGFTTFQTRVAKQSRYVITLLDATKQDGSSISFNFYADDQLVDSVSMPAKNTKSWTMWTPDTVQTDVVLPTTVNKVVMYFYGTKYTVNAMDVTFAAVSSTGIAARRVEEKDKDENIPVYNLSGQRVARGYRGVVIHKGKKLLQK